MDELKEMEKKLDLEQVSDKLMMEEIKKLKIEAVKILVMKPERNLWLLFRSVRKSDCVISIIDLTVYSHPMVSLLYQIFARVS